MAYHSAVQLNHKYAHSPIVVLETGHYGLAEDMFAYTHACTNIYIYTWLHVYIHTNTHRYANTYMHTHTCIHTGEYTRIHTYVQVPTFPGLYSSIFLFEFGNSGNKCLGCHSLPVIKNISLGQAYQSRRRKYSRREDASSRGTEFESVISKKS